MTVEIRHSRQPTFEGWTKNRAIDSLGTNHGAKELPFQNWHNFKEAFAPELVARAVRESPIKVRRGIDPFGGSGTTGIACQFLGVHPVICEVNPYLADLIEAKLSQHPSVDNLTCKLRKVVADSEQILIDGRTSALDSVPRTFVEPGHQGRWIFDLEVAERIAALRNAIENLEPESRRLFRVLLGGILISVSNVRVSGKGRRYRRNWKSRVSRPEIVTDLFVETTQRAIEDVGEFANRAVKSYEIRRGDSRVNLDEIEPCELAVFSPPYANSFDYTDVYNVELWVLGYLDGWSANRVLRKSTLSSHVQVSRDFREPPGGSDTLDTILAQLNSRSRELWDRRIPAMLGGYFSDLLLVFDHLKNVLVRGGTAWIVVGDSRYAGIHVPVAEILRELLGIRGWELMTMEPFRSMRTSAQQGGEKSLSERLVVLLNET